MASNARINIELVEERDNRYARSKEFVGQAPKTGKVQRTAKKNSSHLQVTEHMQEDEPKSKVAYQSAKQQLSTNKMMISPRDRSQKQVLQEEYRLLATQPSSALKGLNEQQLLEGKFAG